jgi:hypothetical protein
LATRSVHKKVKELDKDSLSDNHEVDNEVSDGPLVPKAGKTKVAKKGKNKETTTKLREEIKVNRKRVPAQAARLEVRACMLRS